MKIINLVAIERGDYYTMSIYSDSQVNVIISNIEHDSQYKIVSRFSNYTDLFKILTVNQVLRDAGVKYVELYCPYILGGRSDAKFKLNQSFDLKIIANIINSCNFNKVTIIDPHSAVTPALINNCQAFDILYWLPMKLRSKDIELISPDAGAYKKMVNIAEKIKKPLIPANKVRLDDGSPAIKFDGDVNGKDCVIIDDICDGGRTFIALSKALKEAGAKSVELVVTHGIFSYGIKLENIDKIYTTNSYREFANHDLGDYLNVTNIY